MTAALLLSLVCAAAPDSYVIVVGNNQSPMLGRPQLAYADDDAVRYVEVFEAILAAPTVELLTTLDEDTRRLFPSMSARATPPRRGEVQAAFSRLRAWSEEAKRRGHRTRGYFVFAGHGDIAGGEGFLELEDGRLTAREVEELLRTAGADELHVVLDSCNSWFVLSPRKPGGHRFPTPAEATRALVEKLPNVGVLLSTSAEAEVYEWSDLQSGIFSYALRSGLVGAADANRDHDVSYDELAAFIEGATRTITNPNLRPHIFARAPGGGVQGAFASLTGGTGVAVEAEPGATLRLRVRDEQGLRWFDAALTASSVTLWLPRRLISGGVVERREGDAWRTWTVPAEGRLALQSAKEEVARGQARGVSDALRTLFETPFGPSEVEAWRKADAAAADSQAIGVSRETADRVGFLLSLASQRDRGNRRVGGILGLGLSLVAGGVYATFALNTEDPGLRTLYLSSGLGMGVLGLALGGLSLFPSAWERQAETYAKARVVGETSRAVLELDRFLDARLAVYRTTQTMTRVLCIVVGLSSAGLGVLGFVTSGELTRNVLLAAGGGGFLLSGVFFASTFWTRQPEEDLYDAIREERRLSSTPSVSVGVVPLSQGAVFSLNGTF
ncbi:MAG: hypothetical protein ACOZQL_06660 [Myxococcota bacterium]